MPRRLGLAVVEMIQMSVLRYHPEFIVATNKLHGFRCTFQFTVSGTERSGVEYVRTVVPVGELLATVAEKAAKTVCKRAGATEAILWRVS